MEDDALSVGSLPFNSLTRPHSTAQRSGNLVLTGHTIEKSSKCARTYGKRCDHIGPSTTSECLKQP
jgi:hypothetical protein